MISRREALISLAGAAAAVAWPGRAEASIARAVTLQELSAASQTALLGTALEANSRWDTVGGRKRIVTTTRVRVDETVAGAPPGAEILVRTLGGQVGDIGQIVHGEAFLLLGEAAVLFLADLGGGESVVTGMAQGHYPVRGRLRPSPRLSELRGAAGSAVERLVGQTFTEARHRIQGAWRAP
jgi:hypothetical protein